MRKSAESNGSRKMMFVIVLALLLALVLATLVSAAWTDNFTNLGGKFSGFSSSKWTVILVNGALLAGVGYVGSTLLNTGANKIDDKQIKAIQLALIGVGLLIAYQIYESGLHDLLWKIPDINNFMHIRVIVNLALVAALLYLLYTWLKLKPEKGSGLFDVIIVGVILMMSVTMVHPGEKYDKTTYHYIWEWESVVPFRFYLLGDSGCTFYDYKGQYFEENGKWIYDGFVNSEVTDGNLIPELNKAKELRAKTEEEVTDPEEKRFYGIMKNLPPGYVTAKTKVDKYCYTKESIDEYLKLKSEDKAYTATVKTPSSDEISATGGFGIIRGYHLIIFILGAIILSWAAKVWELMAKAENLSIAISIIIAAMLANAGTSMQSFAWLIQIIIILTLVKSMGIELKTAAAWEEFWTWVALAFFSWIVNWIATSVDPSYGLPIVGWIFGFAFKGLFPTIGSAIVGLLILLLSGWYLFSGRWPEHWYMRLGIAAVAYGIFYFVMPQYATSPGATLKLLLLVLLFAGVIFAGSMWWGASKDKKEKKESMLFKRGRAHISNFVREWLNDNTLIAHIKQWYARMTKQQVKKIPEVDIPGLLPFYVLQNLPLFYNLFNLCKRTWIYYAYWDVVKALDKPDNKDEKNRTPKQQITDGIGNYVNLKKVKKQIIDYRSSPSNLLGHYEYVMLGKEKKAAQASKTYAGWCSHHKNLAKIYNKTVKLLPQALIALEIGDKQGFQHYVGEIQSLLKDMDGLFTNIPAAYSQVNDEGNITAMGEGYIRRLHAYSWHSKLRSAMIYALGMANSAYLFDHTYRFANPEAELEEGGKAGWKVENERYYEVTNDGKFIDDINEFVETGTDIRQYVDEDFTKYRNDATTTTIKKLKDPREVITFSDNVPKNAFQDIISWMNTDWLFWTDDMKYGLYHLRSRSFKDYEENYLKNQFHDHHIGRSNKINRENGSFDRRILTNPGIWRYLGRRNYYDKDIGKYETYNPLPWISLHGITEYLKLEFRRSFDDAHHREEAMALFPAADNLEVADELITSLKKAYTKGK
ncbi:hypothetical protein HYU06_00545 [Candidatus Woesearchaeota archaeon]|nr:hypothetical protein [Candidatus Woesearchaeota archaeon]